VPDWKATDLRAFIHTLPRDGAGIDEALDSKDLFAFEVIDWDSLVLRRDTLEGGSRALITREAQRRAQTRPPLFPA
jgi:hypothetical protein